MTCRMLGAVLQRGGHLGEPVFSEESDAVDCSDTEIKMRVGCGLVLVGDFKRRALFEAR
jgi:hypothetical protein